MDAGPTTSSNYTRTSVLLHWLIAVLIVSTFPLGWVMTRMAISPLKLRMYSWHKWVGMTVLALALLRALWRLTHAPPPFLPMAAWQRLSAHALHGLLYLLLFLQPISGWLYSSAAGYQVVYLGLLPLPNLVAKSKPLAATLLQVHWALGWLLFAALVLHVLAALKHHFFDRDETLRRMLSWRSARKLNQGEIA